MDIGVKNVKKFARVPRMDPNAITCPVNANAVLVIMVITVMNYVPLVLLEAAAQKYAFAESDRMTVTRSMDVASVSLVTLDLCATKVKILFDYLWRLNIALECPSGRWGQDCLKHCDCRNGGKCDFETGVCRCPVNWTGSKCELPCEEVSF